MFSSGCSTYTELDNLSIKLITDDTYVRVQRTINFAIDAGTGSGTTSPSGSYSVNDGDGKTFTLTPGTNMKIESLKINGGDVNVSSLPLSTSGFYYCTLDNVTADTSVNAKFYNPAVGTSTPAPTPTPTATPEPLLTIPAENITVINDPFGRAGTSLIRVDVTGIIDPAAQNLVVTVKGTEAKYTSYSGVNKFVIMVDGEVTAEDVRVKEGTPAQFKYGDVNQADNAVDSTDLNWLKGAMAGNKIAASYCELVASDVNGDRVVNSSDLNILKGYVAGNLMSMPAYSR